MPHSPFGDVAERRASLLTSHGTLAWALGRPGLPWIPAAMRPGPEAGRSLKSHHDRQILVPDAEVVPFHEP